MKIEKILKEAVSVLLNEYDKQQEEIKRYKIIIEKQQKENEELRKQLNEENKRCMMLAIEKQDYFEKYRYNLQQNESLTKEFSNVIPVQKVKDKIEELKFLLYSFEKKQEEKLEYVDKGSMNIILAQISILNAVLEEQ